MLRRLHVPLIRPEDVIPHLAKQELHWKSGFSAKELAIAWANGHNDFPQSVRQVLDTAAEYSKAELIDGFFEREVELGSPGRNSQTDLMVVVALGGELGIIAVEGKVEESFAEIVNDWNNTPGKQKRLTGLCETLGLDVSQAGRLRYQLIHRTASAVIEAKRYRCRHALLLVHSFSATHRWFEDFMEFSRVMGQQIKIPGVCSEPRECAGVSLRVAWVADRPFEGVSGQKR
jgi:hypothetical protein